MKSISLFEEYSISSQTRIGKMNRLNQDRDQRISRAGFLNFNYLENEQIKVQADER